MCIRHRNHKVIHTRVHLRIILTDRMYTFGIYFQIILFSASILLIGACLSEPPYYKMPESPQDCTPHSILLRFIDALGFRYYWATEGLKDHEYEYRPSPDSRSMKELLLHIKGLVNTIDVSFGGKTHEMKKDLKPCEIRRETLYTIFEARKKLLKMSSKKLRTCSMYSSYYDREFPIWNVINGPICDAITHVGQLNSWRRLEGNPIHGANVFLGEPPI